MGVLCLKNTVKLPDELLRRIGMEAELRRAGGKHAILASRLQSVLFFL
jgi:hypothetical protein